MELEIALHDEIIIHQQEHHVNLFYLMISIESNLNQPEEKQDKIIGKYL